VRGIACVALVAYHVIGPTSASGMHLPDGSAWHLLMNSLDFLRMPIFSVVSGFVYARHRASRSSLLPFAQKKIGRLLVPLLFVTAVMLAIRHRIYGEQTSFAQAILFHYQHLWFIQALLLLFAGVALWDAYARPGWVGLLAAAFGSVMISRSFTLTGFLSLNGALYLAPFFFFGMILRIEEAVLRREELVRLAAWIVALVLAVNEVVILMHGEPILRTSLPAAVCGVGGSYLLMVRCPRMRPFHEIGSYSYTIYLWHSVTSSAARHALERWFNLPHAGEFAVLLVAGLGVPILIHRAVERVPVLSLAVAGVRKPFKKPAQEADAGVEALGGASQLLETARLRTTSAAITDLAA
jgi:glucan biosynthesis protein C